MPTDWLYFPSCEFRMMAVFVLSGRKAAFEDLLWALINRFEFVANM